MKTVVFDAKAGRHFDGVNIDVSKHALQRATDHYGVKPEEARAWIISKLRESSLVDDNYVGDDGKLQRLFCYTGVPFIVAPNANYVFTLLPSRNTTADALRDEMTKLLARVLKAAQRKEAREIKRVNARKAELTAERAEMEKAAAESAARIAEINAELPKLDAEIFELKREKSTLAKGVAAYV